MYSQPRGYITCDFLWIIIKAWWDIRIHFNYIITVALTKVTWYTMVFRALKNSFNAHTDVETGFDSLINRSPPGDFFLALFIADIKIKGNTFLIVADRNLSEKKLGQILLSK